MRVSDLPVDHSILRRLAVEAHADPRSVAKVLRGLPVRGGAGNRVREVLKRNGYDVLPRPDLCAADTREAS